MRLVRILLVSWLTATSALALTGDGGNLKVQNGIVVVTGTAGGIPYFNPNNTLNSTALLTSNGVVLGGGTAGPTSTAAGTADQVFRVPSGGNPPAFGALNLAAAAAVTGLLGLTNGGTNANLTAANGQVFYSTASAAALTTGGSTGNCLKFNSGSAPTWGVCSAVAPIIAFGTIGDILQNTALFASPANTIDPTETSVLTEIKNASAFTNLDCKANSAPGAGQTYNIYLRLTQCAGTAPAAQTACTAATAPGGSDLGCAISGASATNCTSANTISPAAGNCIAFCINSSATAATAKISCTAEKSA